MMTVLDRLRHWTYGAVKHCTGSRYAENLRWLHAHQFDSYEDNLACQQKMLRDLLIFSASHIPYYRQLLRQTGVVDGQGRIHLARWSDLPALTRGDLQAHLSQLLSDDASSRRRIIALPTGGTTATPVVPKADLTYWDWTQAQTWLYFSWMGLNIGMPYFYFWGAPQDIGAQGKTWKDKLWLQGIQNRYVLNCRRMSPEIMAAYIDRMNAMPERNHMVACVQELYELACFSQEHGYPVRRGMVGICVTTAALTEPMRETIQSVFGCPVFSRYGSREVGDLACECQYQAGHHVNPLTAFIEVVDEQGQPVPPGVEGRILVTNLHNYLMPLIRYELQDLGIWSEACRCACGRQWPTLKMITGRLHERLVLPDGSTFGKVFLHYIMDPFQKLRAYQFHQVSPTQVEVHVVSPIRDYLQVFRQEYQESLKRFHQVTEQQFQVTYKQVDLLEKTPSGKQLVIVNHVLPARQPMPVSAATEAAVPVFS